MEYFENNSWNEADERNKVVNKKYKNIIKDKCEDICIRNNIRGIKKGIDRDYVLMTLREFHFGFISTIETNERIINRGNKKSYILCGFCLCKYVKNKDEIYIDAICSNPSVGFRGVGSELIKQVSIFALENRINILKLKVHFCNYELIEYYEKNGFKIKTDIPIEITDLDANYLLDKNIEEYNMQKILS